MTVRAARQLRLTVAAIAALLLCVLALDAGTLAVASGTHSSSAVPSITPVQAPLRVITWSGRQWIVYPPSQTGPRGDPLSDSSAAVHVDSGGRLHLAFTKVKGVWRSVQLVATTPPGYGRYRFVSASSPRTMGRAAVLGMFVYKPGAARLTNEIDIENSRSVYGIAPHDAQYVVQPFTAKHHIKRFDISPSQSLTTQQFTWLPGQVSFKSWRGPTPSGQQLNHFVFRGSDVPKPDGENLYVNLWLYNKKNPEGRRSLVLDSFTYTPRG